MAEFTLTHETDEGVHTVGGGKTLDDARANAAKAFDHHPDIDVVTIRDVEGDPVEQVERPATDVDESGGTAARRRRRHKA